MSESARAYLPAREVAKFGLAIIGRLIGAVFVGLLAMKAGQWLFGWVDAQAMSAGKALVAVGFLGSFYFKPLPWPEIDFGQSNDGPPPEPEA